MKKIIKIYHNEEWPKVNPPLDNVELVFLENALIPEPRKIPVPYYDARKQGILIKYNKTEKLAEMALAHPENHTASIANYKELNTMQSKYLALEDPCLLMDTEYLKNFKTAYPNKSLVYEIHFARRTLPNDFFIRPEDLHLYENIFDIVTFPNPNLFNIYNAGTYPLDINTLINLNVYDDPINNTMIDPEFARKRLTCKGRCWCGSPCSYCAHALDSAAIFAEYFSK